MKIGKKRGLNESMNYEAVCRTAPAAPGLLKIGSVWFGGDPPKGVYQYK